MENEVVELTMLEIELKKPKIRIKSRNKHKY